MNKFIDLGYSPVVKQKKQASTIPSFFSDREEDDNEHDENYDEDGYEEDEHVTAAPVMLSEEQREELFSRWRVAASPINTNIDTASFLITRERLDRYARAAATPIPDNGD